MNLGRKDSNVGRKDYDLEGMVKRYEEGFKHWEEGFEHWEKRLYLRRTVLNFKRKLNLGNKDNWESFHFASPL